MARIVNISDFYNLYKEASCELDDILLKEPEDDYLTYLGQGDDDDDDDNGNGGGSNNNNDGGGGSEDDAKEHLEYKFAASGWWKGKYGRATAWLECPVVGLCIGVRSGSDEVEVMPRHTPYFMERVHALPIWRLTKEELRTMPTFTLLGSTDSLKEYMRPNIWAELMEKLKEAEAKRDEARDLAKQDEEKAIAEQRKATAEKGKAIAEQGQERVTAVQDKGKATAEQGKERPIESVELKNPCAPTEDELMRIILLQGKVISSLMELVEMQDGVMKAMQERSRGLVA